MCSLLLKARGAAFRAVGAVCAELQAELPPLQVHRGAERRVLRIADSFVGRKKEGKAEVARPRFASYTSVGFAVPARRVPASPIGWCCAHNYGPSVLPSRCDGVPKPGALLPLGHPEIVGERSWEPTGRGVGGVLVYFPTRQLTQPRVEAERC